MKNSKTLSKLIVLLIVFSVMSCGKSGKERKQIETKGVSIKTIDTPPGADPSISAELGGKGFTGEGWTTNTKINLAGNPKAIKGGQIVMSLPNFPATLRMDGKDYNSYFNYAVKGMIYEGLLNTDPVNESFIPALATHWRISDDKKEFTFRINPDARFADGKPVTSEDVIATWKLLVDPGILDGYTNTLYLTYEQPVAQSKYIFSVKTKELNWRQFLYFAASMVIYPAHYIGNIRGTEFLDKYQFEMIPGSGPYIISKDDIKKGQSISLRRRSDYWAENQYENKGLNNFDLIRFDVISDQSLEFEKFKKGEIDIINLGGTSRIPTWAERMNIDDVDRGIILKRQVYNENPQGVRGVCFNMRKPPFDDIKIRKAFALLFNRELFKEKLFFNSVELMDSYYANSIYENQDNPKVRYNLDEAQKLLAEAGWVQKNSSGYLVKDGRVFELELPFGYQGIEKFLTVFQEDLKKVGIKLNLKQIDLTTNFQLGSERNFQIIYIAWGGLRTPNPESSFKSNTADEQNTTNWSGVKDKRIDEICDEYNITFDKNQRVKQIREIDGRLASIQPYALSWFMPYERISFQNKFGYPKGMLTRTGDAYSMLQIWYSDPEKLAEYEEAQKDKNKKIAQGEIDNKFWQGVKQTEQNGGEVIIDENNY
ncbi:MAG: extracellular solute-binding protein [Bacteroidota bacterium]|nr:extracellular solute-binding protein [Bacteroidota bacterium]